MKIINQSKNTLLADKAVIACTPLARMRGLLGRAELKLGEALILKPCNSVHTFFMRFAIDVLFLDKNNRVNKIISVMKPFCISGIYLRSHSAIELPAGMIKSSLTTQGDTLLLE
ncbi:MAG: DUF192 domain-containing protein [Candidatus Omnitrophica bacterium]|nr:DUF192 domain-containing protein [Candidatus Omnitrophota bacterium]